MIALAAFCSTGFSALAASASTLECTIHDSNGVTYTTTSVALDAKGNASVSQDLASTPAIKVHAEALQNRLIELYLTSDSYPNEKGAIADAQYADQTNLSGITIHAAENSKVIFEGFCNIVSPK